MSRPLAAIRPDESSRQDLARREFLKRSLSAAVTFPAATGSAEQSAVGAQPPSNSDRPMFKVVDTHQHLWDLKKFRLPWTANNPALARDFTMRDYLAATAGIPIAKSVYLEVD